MVMTEYVLADIDDDLYHDQWWFRGWWRNFIVKHCIVISPHLSSASEKEQIAALQVFLAEYNAMILVEGAAQITQSIIFQSQEDYFAFVLEWS
jgi:hypothetical protein